MQTPDLEIVRDLYFEDINEGLYEAISNKITGSWRHGTTHDFIFKRLEDNTIWGVLNYRVSTDGDNNDIRERNFSVELLEPYEHKEIRYRVKKSVDSI